MKGFIGSANIDTNSRLCMASSVAGHQPRLRRRHGAGRLRRSRAGRPRRARRLQPRLVPSGPLPAPCRGARRRAARRSSSSTRADRDLRHRRPASAARARMATSPLFTRPARPSASARAASDRAYVERAHQRRRTPRSRSRARSALDEIARAAGVDADAARALLRHVRGARERVVTVYSARASTSRPSGTDKVNAIINCHLATGRIGKPGHGAVLAHRPAQRHGRARGRRPRQHARRAHGDRERRAPRASCRASGRAPSSPTSRA